MKTGLILFLILDIMLHYSCEKDSTISPKPYPYVVTKEPVVSSHSVHFSAELLKSGESPIEEYGFVWGLHDHPTLQDDHVLLNNGISNESFTYELNFGLASGEAYFVRAYVKNNQYEVYGNTKLFISQGSDPPVITDFTPDHGAKGVKVVIQGNNFGMSGSNLIVKFGEHIAEIDSASETKLIVRVPMVIENEKVLITVESGGKSIVSSDSFDIWFPWKRKADFPNARLYGYSSFEINEKIYICGGNEIGSNVFIPSVWQYDIVTDHWEKKNDFPGDIRKDGIGFSLHGKGYYGMGARVEDIHSTYLTDIWEYDPSTDIWTSKTNYPDTGIVFSKTFILNDQAYIGPGMYWDATFVYFSKSVWAYDPEQNSWSQKADFPGSIQSGMIGLAGNNKGYVGLGVLSADIYEYDPGTDVWTYLPFYPGAGTNHTANFFIDNFLYVGLGGTSNGYSQSDMWQFDPINKTWKLLQSCPTRLTPLFSATIDHKGYTGYGYYDLSSEDEIYGRYVYEFDPERN